MNRRILLALVASCTSVLAARPSAPAAAPVETAPPPSDPSIKVEPYRLQNRSSFALPIDSTRTPMWPIGWVRPRGDLGPVVPYSPTPGVGFLIQPHHLKVTSILTLSGEPLAMINGRAFGEGEVLPVYIGEKPIKVTLKSIRDGGIVVEQNGRQIVVPIQRQLVPDKASDPKQQTTKEFRIPINEK